jgi:hypothetical protein
VVVVVVVVNKLWPREQTFKWMGQLAEHRHAAESVWRIRAKNAWKLSLNFIGKQENFLVKFAQYHRDQQARFIAIIPWGYTGGGWGIGGCILLCSPFPASSFLYDPISFSFTFSAPLNILALLLFQISLKHLPLASRYVSSTRMSLFWEENVRTNAQELRSDNSYTI